MSSGSTDPLDGAPPSSEVGSRPNAVTVFADICCPFTYVSLCRFAAERDARGATGRIRVRAWPLEWVNGEPLDPAHVAREIDGLREAVAPDLFVGFAPVSFPRTSIPAFGLAAAAYDRGDDVGERVSLALRRAVFEHGRDVALLPVLAEIGAPFGVEPLGPGEAEARVRADRDEGLARGVVGSPHIFLTPSDGRFCPTLRIREEEGRFEVSWDEEAFAEVTMRLFD